MTASRRRDGLTRTLGLASAGLGLPLLVATDAVLRGVGARIGEQQRTAARLVGWRELAAAAGLLTTGSPLFLWARAGGDLLDLGLLGRTADDRSGRDRERALTAAGAVVGLLALDTYAAASRSRRRRSTELTATTTVRKSPDEVYAFWSRLEVLPTFMAHLEDVRVTGPGRSTWRASAPFGRSVTWDATTTEDVPGERLSWRSDARARVANEGTVRFRPAPGDRGTEVHVRIRYDVPGGALGRAVARYFGEEPSQQLDDDLRRLKQVLETGEVVRSDGAPAGKRARKEFPQHAAQPLTDAEYEEVRS